MQSELVDDLDFSAHSGNIESIFQITKRKPLFGGTIRNLSDNQFESLEHHDSAMIEFILASCPSVTGCFEEAKKLLRRDLS